MRSLACMLYRAAAPQRLRQQQLRGKAPMQTNIEFLRPIAPPSPSRMISAFQPDGSARMEEATAILEGLLKTAGTPAERADLRRVLALMED